MQIPGQGFKVLKESPPCSHHGADEAIALVRQLQERVKPKGQQVHRHQQRGQMLLAVTKAVISRSVMKLLR